MSKAAPPAGKAAGGRRVPQRQCVVCGRQGEKRQLLRLVRAAGAEGEGAGLDPGGKRAGRGAYVCRAGCGAVFSKPGRAASAAYRKLERALRVALTAEQRGELARALREQPAGE